MAERPVIGAVTIGAVTIGAVTIGQSPREDVLSDIEDLLLNNCRVAQAGALDDVGPHGLASLSRRADQDVLVTRLRDGTQQTLPARAALPLLQRAVDRVAAQGAAAIAVLCTEAFDGLRSPVPLLYPGALAREQAVSAAADRLGVIVPAAEQVDLAERAWAGVGREVRVVAASPYERTADLGRAASDLAGWRADLVVLDCIGFSRAMQRVVEQVTGAKVILPRVALAQAITDGRFRGSAL